MSNPIKMPLRFADERKGPAEYLLEMAKIDATVIWDCDSDGLAISFTVPVRFKARLKFLLSQGPSVDARSVDWNCRYIALVADFLGLDGDLSLSQRKERPLRENLAVGGPA